MSDDGPSAGSPADPLVGSVLAGRYKIESALSEARAKAVGFDAIEHG